MKTNAFLTHRAKIVEDVGSGKWIEGFYVILTNPYHHKTYHCIYPGYTESDCGTLYPDRFEVDEKTVSLYTGIRDKNGKEIYTGDIVKYCPTGRIHEVVFSDANDCAYFGISFPDREEIWGFGHYVPGKILEVIGTVWDNPDLAEKARSGK